MAAQRLAGPDRRSQILDITAALFAERGFHGVSVEDIGAAVGISGPGLYRHFASKDAVLTAMLIGVSEHLLSGGEAQLAGAPSPSEALRRLVGWHVDFALSKPELIRVQDRDLANLSEADARRVRRLQRAYVQVWVAALVQWEPGLGAAEARARTHAVFGLLNSTPYSAPGQDASLVSAVLVDLALACLTRPPVIPGSN